MNRSLHINLTPFLKRSIVKRGAIFGSILLAALLAFELFNYATTAFALSDMLGNLQSAGLHWSTVLALAFCGIDFAGIARLFTPQQGHDEPTEVWYLFGAWLLAASFNAALTWWGVSVAMLHHTAEGSILVGQATLTKAVPVLVAVMVWLIRVLIIGTFSLAGDSLFSMAETRHSSTQRLTSAPRMEPASSTPRPAPRPVPAMRPLPHVAGGAGTAEPTYHPVGMSARANQANTALRQ
jgi:hypothetical protein